ncbi:MAG: DUF4864 domain-containing protein [Albidovulum sp.]
MKRVHLVGAALLSLAASVAVADEAADIRDVIGDQVTAFGAGDLPTAYSFASPDIQAIFPSPEIFGGMVQRGYPMIWQPAEVVYFGLRTEGGKRLQRMGFRDGTGVLHLFDYEMIPGAGGWRIDGVVPVRDDGAAV